jgi:hypothetical protein
MREYGIYAGEVSGFFRSGKARFQLRVKALCDVEQALAPRPLEIERL